MLSWLHKFISPKADGVDSTLVKPSDWNDEHNVTSDIDGFVLGREAGEGGGAVHEILFSDIINVLLPAGMTAPFAGTVVPDGWYLCYGQLLNRLIDARLFSAIGTQYGAGDGATTFALPDYRGVALVGASDMGGIDRGNLPGGGTVGNYLGSPYNYAVTNSYGVAYCNFGNLQLIGGYANPSGNQVPAANSGNGASGWSHDHSVQGYINVNGNFGVNSSGNSGNFSIVQPSVVSNMMIKR